MAVKLQGWGDIVGGVCVAVINTYRRMPSPTDKYISKQMTIHKRDKLKVVTPTIQNV